jgi:hypothetical protein
MTRLIVAYRNFTNAPKYQRVNSVEVNCRCSAIHIKTHKYSVCEGGTYRF